MGIGIKAQLSEKIVGILKFYEFKINSKRTHLEIMHRIKSLHEGLDCEDLTSDELYDQGGGHLYIKFNGEYLGDLTF